MKTMILVVMCMGVTILTHAQLKTTSLKSGGKIILAIKSDTKAVVDILPAESLPDKTTAAKKYPNCTFFAGTLYGDSSRSVRPIEFSDIEKRNFTTSTSLTETRSLRPIEFIDIEKRHFLTIKDTQNFSLTPAEDALMVFNLSKNYVPGGSFYSPAISQFPTKDQFIPGDEFLVMFDKKTEQVVLKLK